MALRRRRFVHVARRYREAGPPFGVDQLYATARLRAEKSFGAFES